MKIYFSAGVSISHCQALKKEYRCFGSTSDVSNPGVTPKHLCICVRVWVFFFFFWRFVFFLVFLLFLGLLLWHMEAARLGVHSELQLLAYARATATWGPG